jgi:NADH dehydrogenase
VLRDVVIAGGGFGGYYAARALERKAPPNVRITLINDVNYLCYAPLLPGGGGGSA